MTDYKKIYQQLWRDVITQEDKTAALSESFFDDFITKLKAQNWQLTADAQSDLNDYFAALRTQIAASITSANGLFLSSMASAEMLKLTEAAFSRRWQDGKTLSDRLWVLSSKMEQGLKDTLQAGIAQSKSASSLIYDLQRSFERDGAQKFIDNYVTRDDDWASDLFASGKSVIKNPKMRKQWEKTVAEAQKIIKQLKTTGTRNAAERAFSQMIKAVDSGNSALLSDAIKWWGYDKQLYYLKRIVRTEMANAAHNAVIDSTIDDDLIIGYQWRLSSSHPGDSVCICGQMANIEMGLGKGVFTKDKIPRLKPHPHCMCTITPRSTKVKISGQFSFDQVSKFL